jgi:hypothetical protein
VLDDTSQRALVASGRWWRTLAECEGCSTFLTASSLDTTKAEKSWEQVKPKAAKKEKAPAVAKDAVSESFFSACRLC